MIRDALVIFRKEARNLLKDRRTLALILVLPLAIMPAVFGTIGAVSTGQQRRAEATMYSVWIEGNEDPSFRQDLAGELSWVPASAAGRDVLRVRFPVGYRPGDPAAVEVFYDSTSTASTYAAGRIQAALERYSERLAEARLREAGLTAAELRTIQVTRVDQAPEQAQQAGILAMLLPYLIVIYLFSGSMNIGLDCTAGERERGSLASVLVNQVSRTSIAVGKVLYVVCAAVANSIASFAGIVIAFRLLGSRMGGAGISADLSAFGAATVVGLLVTLASLALFAAALIVLLGTLAKTVREGGTYILPIYLVVIVIGVASSQMGPSREMGMFLIPIVNAVFSLKEVLLGQTSVLHLAVTAGVNVAAAAVLIRLVAARYNDERILDTV